MTHGGPETSGEAEDVTGSVQRPAMDDWSTDNQLTFWAFHERRYTKYLRYAYAQLGSDADAEEAVAHTFEQIMKKWLYMLGMESLDGYAWSILKGRIVDARRKRAKRPEPTDVSAFEAVLADGRDDFELLAGTIHFYTAVRRLSERQRDAVVLRYGFDLSTAEAAELMGVEDATVRSQLRLARNRLRQLLANPGNTNGDRKVRA
ncbi:RNA polymerase sigma factor (plasmid) [Streptomyces sp. ADI95-16]|uniref:RNA polymerase sigma factor n=2 Tax=unclassified Streptomyces TaxID=2593676 RepID=UPI000F432BCB|nr:sigma-70 family RNA polymerase sigma factor [Streptomyces sp. ADI95-16]AYV25117.1 RNA polymerase sigma factor [Streptomyces sp. ADI95-16]AYV33156.1 RNA polymerase sigma factor [Streptomyces sp. ADI95-16]RPK23971.1 RNA polymerase sigma factor [Streptomyces sp. ADI91-18]